jgi:hypothetical protein
MKLFLTAVCLIFLTFAFGAPISAQRIETEGELFTKISNLTKTKKTDDQEKAYQLSKVFLAKFGKNNDEEVKKVREFADNYEKVTLGKHIDAGKIPEAFTFGKEILARDAENAFVTANLAYAGFKAAQDKKDKTFAADSVQFAKQTLELYAAKKMPKTFEPFVDEAEATALMYYVLGFFSVDSNLKDSAVNFYKSVQFVSKIKNTSYPYAIVALYYEKEFEKGVKEFDAKYPANAPNTAEKQAAETRLEKLMNNMQDAYARSIKLGETEKSPNLEAWKQRYTQIYTFINNGSPTGSDTFLANVLNTPMPDPNAP